MPTPWEAHVQGSAQLTVYPAQAMINAPAWGLGLFQRILSEFNTLAQANLLGVRMVQSNQEPQKNGLGAEVRFDITNGPCPHFDSRGNDLVGRIVIGPNRFKGFCFRALTFKAGLPFSWKAFIFMPENPMANGRTIGDHIKIAVALHELIHACGLSEDDPGHGAENVPAQGDLDLFATGGVVFPGTQPKDDQFLIDGKVIPRNGQYTITPRTASVIQSVWLLGRV
jgi:hypothetical protein